jgi:hydrogenase-1 operon protein HyaF
MKAFPIPIIGESPFPAEADEPLQVIVSPGEMPVFRMPSRRAPSAPEDEWAAGEIVGRLLEAMRDYRLGGQDYPRLVLDDLAPGCIRVLNETLGEGEVSAKLGNLAKVQETAFAGIWRILSYGPDGELASDRLEACAIPDLILEQAQAASSVEIPPPPAGVMNAPALVLEIVDRTRRHRENGETHVINLTLLPMTPEDLEYLDAVLGRGGVSLLSRGYGNCRITATNLERVWWVQYFNASDNLILNTLEITGVPEVALAAPEDIADSIERLADCLRAMQEG